MPSLHYTTHKARELKRELVEVKEFIVCLQHSVVHIKSDCQIDTIPRLIKYLELRRDTIELKLARIDSAK